MCHHTWFQHGFNAMEKMAEDSGGETPLTLREEPRRQSWFDHFSLSEEQDVLRAVLQELRAGYRLASALWSCLRHNSHQKPAEAQVGPIIPRTEQLLRRALRKR